MPKWRKTPPRPFRAKSSRDRKAPKNPLQGLPKGVQEAVEAAAQKALLDCFHQVLGPIFRPRVPMTDPQTQGRG